MLVPLSWIREFCDSTLPPDDLAERLTAAGLEVDSIERIGVFSPLLIVGEIIECRDVPESKKLRVVDLDLGGGVRGTAVTGAPNIGAGMTGVKVACGLAGATLIEPREDAFATFVVAPKTIAGIASDTILCSRFEAGLSKDHSGVLILDEGTPGEPLLARCAPDADSPADVVLEVAVLPNQGRCLSIIGMAREIAALTRTSFRLELDATHLPQDPRAFSITIEDPDLCSRYTGAVFEDVSCRPSPWWLQRRLWLSGHKPINGLVDVTNYVMVEMGQPMHAFDLDRLPAREITVRRARPGELIHTLDQLEGEGGDAAPRELDPSTLLITSGDQPMAVAGVIGGRNSQIFPDTRNILLESANFDPVSVRRTTSQLKVHTDSSYRFSREVDPMLTSFAIQRAAYLLREAAGAKTDGLHLSDVFPRRPESREIDVPVAEIRRSLGTSIEADEMAAALVRLGFRVSIEDGGSTLHVEIPGFRSDVSIAADLAEEVVRVVGFDRIPARTLPEPLPTQRRNPSWDVRQTVREVLAGAGLQDVLTYSLSSSDVERRLGSSAVGPDARWTTVLNPSSVERSAMRRTILAGLLEVAWRNHRQRDRLAFFEIGPVWRPESSPDGNLPGEPWTLGLVLSGPTDEATWGDESPRPVSFFDVKGLLESVLARLHVSEVRFARTTEMPFHPGAAAEIRIAGECCGAFGELHPRVVRAFDLGRRRIFAAEIDLEPWIRGATERFSFEPFSRFPSIREDLNLVVEESVAACDVEAAIRDAAGSLLTDIRLLNLYRGEQLGAEKKSLSFRLTFCAEDRSLEQEEVNAIREAALPRLREALGAEIR